jgi:4-hydroxy 2-oxovalerate aldolase
MISLARSYLNKTKLSVHVIPGLATIDRDIEPAIKLGVDIFRIASHCTEASITKTHIEYLVRKGKTVYGALMMCATCSLDTLVGEVEKMKSYGASAVIIMDSTGSFFPKQVEECFKRLTPIGIKLGFHAHNNLGLAVANSLAAIEHGAEIIDATVHGFGAGAGNTPLEVMTTVYPSGNINLLETVEEMGYDTPVTKNINILTAKNKLHSVFEKKILESSQKYKSSSHQARRRTWKQEFGSRTRRSCSGYCFSDVRTIIDDFVDISLPMIRSIVSMGKTGDISSMGGANIEPSL